MIYAIKLISVAIEYVYRVPSSLAFSLSPQWYFESALIAHSLKTPLSSLSLALDEACISARSPRKLQRALKQAQIARNRLQLLLFNRENTGQTMIDVDQELGRLKIWYRSMDKNVQVVGPAQSSKKIKIYGNQHMFEQLVENLINNGLRASGTNAVIVVSTQVCERRLNLVIQDFGVGMSGRELLLCELGGYTNHADGWGIGLSCARRIINSFRGQLRIRSWEHVGTQIICTLPLDRG